MSMYDRNQTNIKKNKERKKEKYYHELVTLLDGSINCISTKQKFVLLFLKFFTYYFLINFY